MDTKTKKRIYLDNAATTQVDIDILEQTIKYFSVDYGNASGIYKESRVAKNAIDLSRDAVANLINSSPDEIYFTAGGSESDNWALRGLLDKSDKKHIITTKIEHQAILNTCKYLESKGYNVTYLDVDKDGVVDPASVEAAIRPDTIIVSIMLVNNEVGTVEPIKEICETAHAHNIIVHTDAVQALGNIPIDVKDLKIDLMSMSSHKIYGPKGVGALYMRTGINIPTFIHGGAQERKKRAGTENVPAIIGFGKAAEIARLNFENHVAHISSLRDHFVKRVLAEIEDTHYNGSKDNRHPGNANITFEYVEGESILLYLDFAGIRTSSGSACSSKSLKPSHVLTAMGIPIELIHGSIRFTFGDPTTMEDVDYTVDRLKEIISRLREISSVSKEKGWK